MGKLGKTMGMLFASSICLANTAYADIPFEDWSGETDSGYGNPVAECALYSKETITKWSLGVDFLYWHIRECGLPFGPYTFVEGETLNGTELGLVCQERSHPNFRWNPGVRINLGYACGEKWRVSAHWTNIYGKADKSLGLRGSTHWQLNYNDLDLRLAKDFYAYDVLYNCSETLFTPYVGLRAAWIHQKQRNCTVAFVHTQQANESLNVIQNNRSHYGGVGPELGLDFEWLIRSGWSVYANLAGAVLFGRFNVTYHEKYTDANATNEDKFRKHRSPCQPIFDAALGVRWRGCFFDRNFLAQLGLERHQIFNQNQITRHGDLYLQGVTLGMGVEW